MILELTAHVVTITVQRPAYDPQKLKRLADSFYSFDAGALGNFQTFLLPVRNTDHVEALVPGGLDFGFESGPANILQGPVAGINTAGPNNGCNHGLVIENRRWFRCLVFSI
jgi:hypothetical protein